MLGRRVGLRSQSVQFFRSRLRCSHSSLEPSSVFRRSRGHAARQLLVIGGELTHRGRRLRIQVCQALAVRAHAGAQIPTRVSDEALRHRDVPLRFGWHADPQCGEMSAGDVRCRPARRVRPVVVFQGCSAAPSFSLVPRRFQPRPARRRQLSPKDEGERFSRRTSLVTEVT